MQFVNTDKDPFEGFTAQEARSMIVDRKRKELAEKNFEETFKISKLQYYLLLSWMVNLIRNEAEYTDNTQIELYLTEQYYNNPKKWTDPDFRQKWSEIMKNGGMLGDLLKIEFEKRGFKFNFIITNAFKYKLDPLRYPDHEKIDGKDYWDIKATIKWGEENDK